MTELGQFRRSYKVTVAVGGVAGPLVTARYATGLCVRPGRPDSRIEVMG